MAIVLVVQQLEQRRRQDGVLAMASLSEVTRTDAETEKVHKELKATMLPLLPMQPLQQTDTPTTLLCRVDEPMPKMQESQIPARQLFD
jgi:hypothetical protein